MRNEAIYHAPEKKSKIKNEAIFMGKRWNPIEGATLAVALAGKMSAIISSMTRAGLAPLFFCTIKKNSKIKNEAIWPVPKDVHQPRI